MHYLRASQPISFFKDNEPICGWMVGWTVVSPAHQVSNPVLAYTLNLFQYFRRHAFSGRKRSCRLRGAYGDSVKSQYVSLSKMLIGVRYACVRS